MSITTNLDLINMADEPSNQRTVEFFLSSLWSWLPEGRKRILEALESCDLVRGIHHKTKESLL